MTDLPAHILSPVYEVYDLGDAAGLPYAESTDLDMARDYLRTCTGRGVLVRVVREVVDADTDEPDP